METIFLAAMVNMCGGRFSTVGGHWPGDLAMLETPTLCIFLDMRVVGGKVVDMASVPETAEHARPDDERRRSDVAKKAFFRIAELWGLQDKQAAILLGSPSRQTVYNWKKGEGGALPKDTMERISCILGIYKALQILFSPEQADSWPSKPNESFDGRSALDQMLVGNVSDLYEVRRYLDHVRGGRS